MHALHLTHHFPFVETFDTAKAPAVPETTAAQNADVHPAIDLSMLGAWTAVLLWMALFAGFLYSWFTMGS